MARSVEHFALHIIQAEFLDIDATWDTAGVRSTFWRCYINNRDSASIAWRWGSYRLLAGRLHLVPAYLRFDCHNSSALRHLYVHFDVLALSPFMQQQVFDRPFSMPLTASSRRLLEYCGEASISGRSIYRDCLIKSALFEALSHYIAELPPEQRRRLDESVDDASPIAPAMAMLESRLPAAVRVSELAAACALSEDHFGRVFRATIGQTPARYILERRIALAARELLYEDRGIDQVAQKHGFANRFHFTRAFSRIMGATPGAYRQTSRV